MEVVGAVSGELLTPLAGTAAEVTGLDNGPLMTMALPGEVEEAEGRPLLRGAARLLEEVAEDAVDLEERKAVALLTDKEGEPLLLLPTLPLLPLLPRPLLLADVAAVVGTAEDEDETAEAAVDWMALVADEAAEEEVAASWLDSLDTAVIALTLNEDEAAAAESELDSVAVVEGAALVMEAAVGGAVTCRCTECGRSLAAIASVHSRQHNSANSSRRGKLLVMAVWRDCRAVDRSVDPTSDRHG